MSVNKFFSKKYDDESYNCLHFLREVWLEFVGEDLGPRLTTLLDAKRQLKLAHARAFKRLSAPVSPCIMVMTQLGRDPHVGMYLNGKILHIRKAGVEFLPPVLACRGATSIRYYR